MRCGLPGLKGVFQLQCAHVNVSCLVSSLCCLPHSLRSPALPILHGGCSKHMPGEPGTCFCGLSPASYHGVDTAHSRDMLGCRKRNCPWLGVVDAAPAAPREIQRGPEGGPSTRQSRGPWQSRAPHAHFLLVPRAHGAGLATNCHSAPMHNSCPHVPICASFN